MKSLIFATFLLLAISSLSSCASRMSKSAPTDNAHPYADIQDGFMTQEPRTVREERYQPNDFFFKHCDQKFGASHYSKTAYFCNDR